MLIEEMLRELAEKQPQMPLSMALAWCDSPADMQVPDDLDNAYTLALWVTKQPTVVAFMQQGKNIHAIKEIRALSYCSLYQAKHAYEAAKGLI